MRSYSALCGSVIAVFVLAACGKNMIKPDATADTVARSIERKTGFKPTDVECPDGIEAKVGGTFDCHFTGPEGPYTATLTIRSVDGTKVIYAIDSHRGG